MEYKEFKAKTVEDAITEASIALGMPSDSLEIEVVSEGSTGLLGIFSKDAVIRVREKAAKREDPVEDKAKEEAKPKKDRKEKKDKKENKGNKENKPVVKEEVQEKKEKAPAAPLDTSKAEADIKKFLSEVLEKMEMPAEIEIETDAAEKSINVNLESDNSGDIIGKRGATLDALQYLASIIANKDNPDYFRVKLDTKNYRERRQKTLENLAKNVAAKVKKTRRKVVLEPMNPYERRIIHAYLQSDDKVTTKSEGEEPNRRVVVYYKK